MSLANIWKRRAGTRRYNAMFGLKSSIRSAVHRDIEREPLPGGISFRSLVPLPPLEEDPAAIKWSMLIYGRPIIYSPARSLVFIDIDDEPKKEEP